MRVLSIDITGKVSKYDDALYMSLIDNASKDDSILCMTPYRKYTNDPLNKSKFFCLVSEKKAHSDNLPKRALKASECMLNYIYLIRLVSKYKPDVLHLQWLPFLELSSIETFILKRVKKVSPKTKIILTIHNIYPHNMSEDKKIAYKERFMAACKFIDSFIVHTNVSKHDVINNFSLKEESVHVCFHGVFKPSFDINIKTKQDDKLHILQFGGQSRYKGTDLLVQAVCGLPQVYKAKIKTNIVGGISQSFLDELKAIDNGGDITWKPYFLSDDELNQEIAASDIIVLPYRAISQSGVLLLSIYFKKMLICSDLPSFKETLHGVFDESLDEDMFFKSENVDSLQELIIRYIEGSVPKEKIYERMDALKKLYSWENASLMTWQVYKA